MVEMTEACMETHVKGYKYSKCVCQPSFFLLSKDVQCYDGCLWLDLCGSALQLKDHAGFIASRQE